MDFHKVNCGNKCNVPNKKILVTSNNKFLQETAVLRRIVAQTKTLPLVTALFTVAILFILCALKSRLYFAVGEKKEDTDLRFFLIFSQVSTLRSILAAKTAGIIIKGWKPAHHFQNIYWLREH